MLGCCLCSKLFGKKLDPHEEAMQILKEQLAAARVPQAVVGMWPLPVSPTAGKATGPDHSLFSALQGHKEMVAAVKPVTSSRYQLRALTGHPAATRSPGIAGQSRGIGGARVEWSTSSFLVAPGDAWCGLMCLALRHPHGITVVPSKTLPAPQLAPVPQFPQVERGWWWSPTGVVQGFPSLRSLRLTGAPARGAAGPDPATPELQRGLLHLPQRALENLHPQRGAGVGTWGRAGVVEGLFAEPEALLGWSLSWQVFYPKDSINNPLLLDLIFRQVKHRAGPAALPEAAPGAGVSPRLGCPAALHPFFLRSSRTRSPTPASASARRSGSA